MSDLQTQMETDLGKIQSEFSCSFSWGGSTVTGYLSNAEISTDLSEGGFIPEHLATLYIKRSLFSTAVTGDEITLTAAYDTTLVGKKFRVATITHTEGKVMEVDLIALS